MAQLELLADMCRGRSQLPIVHLERSFPYATLLNLAGNALLPRRFKAVCLGLVQVRPPAKPPAPIQHLRLRASIIRVDDPRAP